MSSAGSRTANSRLQSRLRSAMQAEVAEVALDLILTQGFDETTAEQIAAAAGVSRSTFFRYFPTKEDVVLGNLAELGRQLFTALADRPDDEPPWTSLRRAIDPVIAQHLARPDKALELARAITTAPSLRARHVEKTFYWQELLVPEIARRLGLKPGYADPRPAALVSAALGCLDAGTTVWVESGGELSLSDLLDTAMDAVG